MPPTLPPDEGPSPPRPTPPTSAVRAVLLRVGLALLFVALLWSLRPGMTALSLPSELRAADAALRAGNVAEARAQYDRLLAARPGDPERYVSSANDGVLQHCQAHRRWPLVVEYAQRAVRECKDAPPSARAGLYSILAIGYTEARPPGWQAQAVLAAERAWELNRQNPAMLNQYGYLLADIGPQHEQSLQRAHALVTTALRQWRQEPQSPQVRLAIANTQDSYGWVLYRQGKHDAALHALNEAVTNLHEAVANMPDDPRVAEGVTESSKVIYYHLGVAYRAVKRPDDARQALLRALHYDPKYAEALNELKLLPTPTLGKPVTPPPPTATTPQTPAPAARPTRTP